MSLARAQFQRLDPDLRRQSLINATARCLARYGVGGSSVRVICAEAGVSAGLLRHYFAGIDELIAETYADVGERLVATMAAAADNAGPDPRDQLRAFVMASFKPPIADPDMLATWLAFWSLIKTDARIRELHTRNYASHRIPVEKMVAKILGPEASRVDVRLTAVGVTALVDGLWLELCLDSSSFTPEEAVRIADKWLNALVGDPLKVLAD
ncbi:TetR family transcriptional regulator C-terminal domain-containing protein [Sphingosinicella microcystinivorans]|uniref:TetR family transcriptional regulator C-terminal domain-containing protein n=1 Tax=Sphingosinicella microcystinivorans TaxID=335406 RepID=UPI003B66E815